MLWSCYLESVYQELMQTMPAKPAKPAKPAIEKWSILLVSILASLPTSSEQKHSRGFPFHHLTFLMPLRRPRFFYSSPIFNKTISSHHFNTGRNATTHLICSLLLPMSRALSFSNDTQDSMYSYIMYHPSIHPFMYLSHHNTPSCTTLHYTTYPSIGYNETYYSYSVRFTDNLQYDYHKCSQRDCRRVLLTTTITA
jgi:hypothetical protein